MERHDEIVLKVRKGVKVTVVESETPHEGDARIPTDRDLVLSAPTSVKLAVREVFPENSAVSKKAALIVRCG